MKMVRKLNQIKSAYIQRCIYFSAASTGEKVEVESEVEQKKSPPPQKGSKPEFVEVYDDQVLFISDLI